MSARDELDDMLAQEWPTAGAVVDLLPLVLEAAREAGKAEYVEKERCAYCGHDTTAGIFVRAHPESVNYPAEDDDD